MNIRLFVSTIAIAAASVLGCQGRAPVVGTSVQPITVERQNPSAPIVEVVSRRYGIDDDVTLASYAAGNMDGCSANMIGPNVLMSAAHCGFQPHSIRFRTYRNANPLTSDTETFQCNHLLQTFADTDLMLLFCNPNNGVSPGDKYGYLDFEPRPIVTGEPVYSIWRNPVTDPTLNLPDAQLFSLGTVTATNNNDWYVPNSNPNTGISMNLWSQGGASGSATLSPATHRIVIGPTSVGGGSGAGGEGMNRGALSIQGYLNDAIVGQNIGSPGTLNAAALSAFGLAANDYTGGVDKDDNDLFDVQETIEKFRGENRRDHVWLGFESPRRNALWRGNSYTFDPQNLQVHLNVPSSQMFMRHDRLNLMPNAKYRVSVMLNTRVAQFPKSLTFRILDKRILGDGSTRTTFNSQHALSTTVGSGWVMETFHLETSRDPAELQLVANSAIDISLAALSMIAIESVMNFDTHDKRYNWRNDNDGSRGEILPDGNVSNTPNWAGVVRHKLSTGNRENWPLRNRQLALVRGQPYRVCFDHKLYTGPTVVDADWGIVRVTSGATVVSETRFKPTPNWTQTCSSSFIPTSGDNVVRAGSHRSADISNTLSYLIDDIRIEGL